MPRRPGPGAPVSWAATRGGSIGGAPASPALPERSSGLWSALLSSRLPLLLALLGGIVVGIALALLSLLAPGVLPTLG